MYSKIIQRRCLGVARPERDILNDPGVFGEVTMYNVGGHQRLDARAHGNTTAEARLLQPLWDPVCLAKGPRDEQWRGYQRAKLPHGLGITTVVQEWHIEHIDMRPPVESARVRYYEPHRVLGADAEGAVKGDELA